MPTRAEILSQVDARYADWEPALQAAQEAHLQEHGRYLQGTIIASTMPKDGAEVAADRVDTKPSDERYTWRQALTKYVGISPPSTVLGSLEVHVYDGPKGKGYVTISRHRVGRDTWMRLRGYGPEDRDREWEVTRGAD